MLQELKDKWLKGWKHPYLSPVSPSIAMTSIRSRGGVFSEA
ncbi:hypothetical protein N9079_02760 [bacterium]|nr:hypothetical protein [Verrucomicrobiota bacterium]MDB4485335.1 hypothetical protein [bacterium]